MHIDAAAPLRLVARDRAALYDQRRIRRDVHAAAALRVAARDFAAANAVDDRQGGVVLHLDDVTIIVLLVAVAVQGVTVQINRDCLLVHLDLISAVLLAGDVRAQLDHLSARRLLDRVLQAVPVTD